MTWRLAGMIMIVPTLLVAADITWRNRKNIHELFPNLAVCCWICANATWMTSEFYFYDQYRNYAKIFFGLGFLLVVIYYAFFFKHHASEEHSAGQ